MAQRLGSDTYSSRSARGLFFALITVATTAWPATPWTALAGEPGGSAPAAKADEPLDADDLLAANAACCVCHTTFVKEELAKQHLENKVPCTKCHGLSDKHANDEHIGATKPDVLYPRVKIDAACEKCHEDHNVPGKKVVRRFVERKLSSASPTVCTDCHGHHKIERSP